MDGARNGNWALPDKFDRMIRSYIKCHEGFLWQELFINKSLESVEEQLYILANLTNRIVDKNSIMTWPRPLVMYLLLSNSVDQHDVFKQWDFKLHARGEYGGGFSEGIMPIIQFCLNGQYDSARKELEYVEGRASHKGELKTSLLFAKGLIKNRQDLMEESFQNMLRPRTIKSIQRVHGLSEQLINTRATLMLRVAWLMGYEIEVDSPLVPMELMPIKPSIEFDLPYDFLK